ncbi:MAG: homocysteine S-methyltransferase family protein, partial [Deltaproteobacteria bacterium]|nr:homocysteine S-methyltransferase family protein [Nannocystaceae bacterium]
MIRLLDGAVGTELARRGFVLAPPSFSAAAIEHAPELLAAIHRDHVLAGAELVTAGTTCV